MECPTNTLATLELCGVKRSMPATGKQTLSATLTMEPLHLDQLQQHQDLAQPRQLQQQRHQDLEVLPLGQTLRPAALEHYVEAHPQSL